MRSILVVVVGCQAHPQAPVVEFVGLGPGTADTGAPPAAPGCQWAGEWLVEGAYCAASPYGPPTDGWAAWFYDLDEHGSALTIRSDSCTETLELTDPENRYGKTLWVTEADGGCGEAGRVEGIDGYGLGTVETEAGEVALYLYGHPPVFGAYDLGCLDVAHVQLVPYR